MTSNSISYLGWMFLPNLATSFLQSFYYRVTIRAGSPHPQPSSPQFARHHRIIRTFVILSYLAYTLYEAYHNILLASDFYSALELPPTVEDPAIKSRFRRLAARHHPDKNVSSGSTDGDEYFTYLKTAQDTLLDPAKRWAYERFGPDILKWRNCATIKDYFYAGLQATVPSYIAGLAFLILLSWLGYIPWGRFWRFYTLAPLLTLELYLMTTPTLPSLPLAICRTFKLPPLLPFQILSLARTLSITLSIATSQLSPPASQSSFSSSGTSLQTVQNLNHLSTLAHLADAEATRLLSLSLAPFRGDGDAVKDLRGRMREWVILGRVRGSKRVREVAESKSKELRRRAVMVEDSEG